VLLSSSWQNTKQSLPCNLALTTLTNRGPILLLAGSLDVDTTPATAAVRLLFGADEAVEAAMLQIQERTRVQRSARCNVGK